MDLGPLFDTPQITTGEDGVHRDAEGRRHELVVIGDEATYVLAEVVAAVRPSNPYAAPDRSDDPLTFCAECLHPVPRGTTDPITGVCRVCAS